MIEDEARGLGEFVHALLNTPSPAGPPYTHSFSREAPVDEVDGIPVFDLGPTITIEAT